MYLKKSEAFLNRRVSINLYFNNNTARQRPAILQNVQACKQNNQEVKEKTKKNVRFCARARKHSD